jgi:hypothetical protein
MCMKLYMCMCMAGSVSVSVSSSRSPPRTRLEPTQSTPTHSSHPVRIPFPTTTHPPTTPTTHHQSPQNTTTTTNTNTDSGGRPRRQFLRRALRLHRSFRLLPLPPDPRGHPGGALVARELRGLQHAVRKEARGLAVVVGGGCCKLVDCWDPSGVICNMYIYSNICIYI